MWTRSHTNLFTLGSLLLCTAAWGAPLDIVPPSDSSSKPPRIDLLEGIDQDGVISGVADSAGMNHPSKFDDRFKDPGVIAAAQNLAAGKVHEAIGQLRAVAEADPSMPPEMLMMAYILLRSERWNEGAIALEKAAVFHKEHPEVYQACGQFALSQGRNTDAWSHFQLALRMETPEGWREEQKREFAVRCYLGLASVSENRQDWYEAVRAFASWNELESLDAVSLYRWAKALLYTDEEDLALEKLVEAQRKMPSLNRAEVMLAALHTERGQFDKARTWYEAAIKKYPEDARIYYEFAGSLLLAGESMEAGRQLAKARQAAEHVEELGAELTLMQGLVARSQQEYPEAEALFTQTLKDAPGNADALTQLPLVLVEQEDDAKRQRALQIAMLHSQKNPRSVAALTTLGWVQFRLGKLADAEQSLLKAAKGGTSNGETLYFLVQVLLANGKANQATPHIEALRTTIEQPGMFILRKQASKWLESVALALD